jgi:hypothetical protein
MSWRLFLGAGRRDGRGGRGKSEATAWRLRVVIFSIRHAPLAQQPGVHDLPLVPASRLKIQKRRSRLLQFKKELERISGASLPGIDGLRLDPPVPLPDDQRLRFPLFHSLRVRLNREFPICEYGKVKANDHGSGFCHEKAGLKFPGFLKIIRSARRHDSLSVHEACASLLTN